MKTYQLITALGILVILSVQCKKEQTGLKSEKPAGPGMGSPNNPAGNSGSSGNAAPGPVYNAIIATGQIMNRSVTAPGSILAEENTSLQPEISGRLIGIYFKEGTLVNKGVLLAKLYDADLKAQRSKLDVQLKIAEASEKRQLELLAVNGTSQQEYDLATLQVSNIKADLDLNSVNLSRTEIRAPYHGRIGLRNVSPGAYVTPTQIISNIAQVSSLKIQFNVLEKYARELTVGKIVSFKTESSINQYQAKITAFENTLTDDTRQLRIRAQVIKPDAKLIPGSFISVFFGTGSNEPVIMVPAQAIIPQARDRKVIVNRGGIANFATVITGYRDSAKVEIISGLNLGDTVVTTGLLSIRPGSKINIAITN